jgi:hypothetical protein
MRLGERCRPANSGNTTLRLGGEFYTGGTNSAVARLSSGTELAYDRTDEICEWSVVLLIVFDVPLGYGANIQVCGVGETKKGGYRSREAPPAEVAHIRERHCHSLPNVFIQGGRSEGMLIPGGICGGDPFPRRVTSGPYSLGLGGAKRSVTRSVR